MKLYVLDTDIAGFVQHEHPTVLSRINALPDADTLATTIITIAAITLSVNGILVTRNVVDFERIPALRVEDWTQ
ncbi:MAG: hypothetical protein AABO57_19935 [Acidobacteriota bacterium]